MMQTPASLPKEPAVLLDLSAIKSGGGAQLALNFLQAVNLGRFGLRISLVLVSDEFPFRDRLQGSYAVAVAPSRLRKRILYEYRDLPKLVRAHGITHSYTFFGPGLPRIKGLRQIVGVAYPILVYGDSPYWRYLEPVDRLRRKVKNLARKHRLARADHLVFETEVMRRRAQDAGLVHNGASVIPPTPTAYLHRSDLPEDDGTYRILFLSGTDPHKNLWRLPEVLRSLVPGDPDIRLMVSVERSAFLSMRPFSAEDVLLIDRYIEFLGSLRSDDLQRAYDCCHALANLADLESFSNNYMESWLVGRPILASDRDFARSICGDSAIYAEPHDPASVLEGLKVLASGAIDLAPMLDDGRRRLAALPTMQERLNRIAKLIKAL